MGGSTETAIAQPDSPKPRTWTGGQKAGWFFVGLFLGIPGIIIASLANVDHPDRSTATKMAAIGMAVELAIVFAVIFLCIIFLCIMMTVVVDGAAPVAASAYYY